MIMTCKQPGNQVEDEITTTPAEAATDPTVDSAPLAAAAKNSQGITEPTRTCVVVVVRGLVLLFPSHPSPPLISPRPSSRFLFLGLQFLS